MKSLESTLCSVIKTLAINLPRSDCNPIVRDNIYCGKLFLSEAAKAAMGQRVRSSRTLALELASQRARRLRFYRKIAPSA